MTTATPPRLTGDAIQVTKRVQITVRCPKCQRSLDITEVKVGATIECPDCSNVTWAPEYVPRWWHRSRNFLWAVAVAFAVGILSSLVASYLWDNYRSDHPAETQEGKTGASNVN